jgi:formyl-CoA transferase
VVPVLSESPGTIRFAGSSRPGRDNAEIYTGLLGRSGAELEDLQQQGVL